MNMYVIIGVLLVIAVLAVLVLLYKYKREYLTVVAYYAVIGAEDMYHNGHGKEKLLIAIREVKSKVPWYLSWLISEKFITGLIESALLTLQGQFKTAKQREIEALNEVIKVGKDTGNLKATIKTAEDIKEGKLQLYMEGKTDFHGKNSIAGGVKYNL